jgi:hypothetical protein
MVPSVRNAEAGHLHVLENANCTKMFHSVEFEKTASHLKAKKSELQTFELASLDQLLDANAAHFPYNKEWSTSWKEPVIIAHSSGSTGMERCFNGLRGVFFNQVQDFRNRSQSQMVSSLSMTACVLFQRSPVDEHKIMPCIISQEAEDSIILTHHST